jgi:hypothetical protein
MTAHVRHHSRWTLVTFAAALTLAGCGDHTATGPSDRPAISASDAARHFAAAARDPDLGQCDELAVPEGSTLIFHTYAAGVQKYEWDGGTWAPRGPSAKLYADAAGKGAVGIHYGGPTWESHSGSFVVGQLKTPCDVGPANIPWLLLDAVRSGGPGIFDSVAYIQRVNTVGGRAPAAPGSLGEVKHVPYTAEYFFYRAR